MKVTSLADEFNNKFIGTDDLRRELADILRNLPKENRIVITQHGKPKAVLLDLNTYLELLDIQEDVIQPGYIDSLYKELEAAEKGKKISHEDLVKKLNL